MVAALTVTAIIAIIITIIIVVVVVVAVVVVVVVVVVAAAAATVIIQSTLLSIIAIADFKIFLLLLFLMSVLHALYFLQNTFDESTRVLFLDLELRMTYNYMTVCLSTSVS